MAYLDDQASSAVFVHDNASVPTCGGDAVQCLCRRLWRAAKIVTSFRSEGDVRERNGELQVSV